MSGQAEIDKLHSKMANDHASKTNTTEISGFKAASAGNDPMQQNRIAQLRCRQGNGRSTLGRTLLAA